MNYWCNVSALCLLLFCSISGAASAGHAANSATPQSLAELSARLSETQFLTSSFRQTRKLRLLPKPLTSRGDMTYVKSLGICWQLEKPVAASIFLGENQIVLKDKATEQRIENANPVLALFSQLFFAVFSGDFSVLENEFSITWESNDQGWIVTLLPIGDLVAKVAHTIVIRGGEQIESVLLLHAGDDSTKLQFSAINVLDHQMLSLECGDEKY